MRAVIFDMDGVLADTEPLHFESYRTVLASLGVEIDLEEYRHRFISRPGGPEYVCQSYGLPICPEELRARKAPAYFALLLGNIAPRTGALEAVARLRPEFRLGVATNSARAELDLVLDRLDLVSSFEVTVAREDYGRAKPEPDAYLEAAVRLGVAATDCAVVEDTARGVAAGLAAGMLVIAAPNDLTFDNDFSGAVRIEHLDELVPEILRR